MKLFTTSFILLNAMLLNAVNIQLFSSSIILPIEYHVAKCCCLLLLSFY